MKAIYVGASIITLLGIGVTVNTVANLSHRGWIQQATQVELAEYYASQPSDVGVQVQLGALLVADKDARGIDLLSTAANTNPENIEIFLAYVNAIDDPNVALEAIEKRSQIWPDAPRLLAAKARRMVEVGQVEDGLSKAEQVLLQDKQNPDALRVKADALMLMRRIPEASQALKDAVKVDNRTDLRLLLAMTLVPQQRYADLQLATQPIVDRRLHGVSQVQDLRARLYLSGATLNGPASGYNQTELIQTLLSVITSAEKLEPSEQFLPFYFLGEVYLRGGQPHDAVAVLQKAVVMAPQFPASTFALARAFQQAGNAKAAAYLYARHRKLSHLLGELDSVSIRLDENSTDAALLANVARLSGQLEELLRQPLQGMQSPGSKVKIDGQ